MFHNISRVETANWEDEEVLYIVGDVEIDEDAFELSRKGSRVSIEPRVLEFILHLIRNRSRLVTKDELILALWRSFVVDSVVTRCACLARKALGNPSHIRTIYGRGYRWSGPITYVRNHEDSETIRMA